MTWPDYNDLTDAQASSAFQSAASANSLKVAGLSAIGQLQLACANLLLGDAPVGDIPAGEIAPGTFASSSSSPTGAFTFAARLNVTGAQTAAAGVATGSVFTITPTAAANNDTLTAVRAVVAAGTPGAFTGLVRRGIAVDAFTVVGDTTPGNPVGIDVGIITGTGATLATALRLAPPTGAGTNYLISHTTPATFNVTAAGAILTASQLYVGSAQPIGWTSRTVMQSTADGNLLIQNAAGNDFGRLMFGSTTTSYPALIRAAAGITVGLADGTAAGGFLGVGIAASSTSAITAAAATTALASIRLPHGTAPSAPVDGDMWTTTSGLFVRINGVTVGPLS